jgi:hypothetical protein
MPVKLQLQALVAVRDAILGTFPRYEQVAAEVDRVRVDLHDLDGPQLRLPAGILRDVVFDLVKTWNGRGLIADLIGGLARAAPFSPDLRVIQTRMLQTFPAVEIAALQGFVSATLIHQDATSWVDTLSIRMRAVCRVDFNAFDPPGIGTGFLVAPDLVLTAHHVVENLNPARPLVETAVCRFEYINNWDRKGRVVRFMRPQWQVALSLPGGIEKYPGGSEPGPDELDFALIRLEHPIDAEPVRFATDAAEPKDPLIVLQHPRRAPLRVAFGQTIAYNANGTRLQHNAGTETGSSGSPCLNQRLEVVGLHNATRYPPHGALADYNTAVPMLLILQAFKAKNVDIAGAPA